MSYLDRLELPGVRGHEDAVRLLERQLAILKARENLMCFTRFTMPDPEDPDDATRSTYDNQRYHDLIAEAFEEFERGDTRQLIFAMPPRAGKQIADSEPVLTPYGWVRHGDLAVDDYVFGPDGRPARVLAVSAPSAEKLQVTFSDGSVIKCHPDHEWTVFDRARGAWRIMETHQIGKRVLRNGPPDTRGGRWTLQLPDISALQFPAEDFSMDPYTLGVWLGDGTSLSPSVTMCFEDMGTVCGAVEAAGYAPTAFYVHKTTGVPTVRFSGPRPGVSGRMWREIKELGLADNKHIPPAYLRGSVPQRLALLAGLIDTDGYVEPKTGRVVVTTCMEALARGIHELCTGLGFRPYTETVNPKLSSSGIQGKQLIYRVGFQPNLDVPTRLERKRITKFGVRRRIGIVAVDHCDPELGRCIQVDRPDGLYLVGRNLIPTHNSELAVKRFTAWYSGRHPDHDMAIASYNDNVAEDIGSDVRAIIQSPQYKQVFPDYKLRKGGAAKGNIQTSQGGRLVFVGRGGGLTSKGAHCLVLDDLYKDYEEARSPTIRENAWFWFTRVALTRRMGMKLVALIGTRWHEDDIVGRLTNPENPCYSEKEAEKWKIIKLPALAEHDDPLGRSVGEPLWPDRYGLDFLESQRNMDPQGFEALYQQRPSAADGTYFKRENIRLYDRLPDNLKYYSTSDHAVGTKQRNDPTCILKAGLDENDDLYVTESIWDRFATDIAVEMMASVLGGKNRPLLHAAEKGHISMSIGPFLYKRLAELGIYPNIVEIVPSKDKLTRAQAIIGRVARGKVYFPRGAPWLERAINQMLSFPNGTHDDFVDALALFGIILQSMFRPRKEAPKQVEPEFGTLAWAKYAETYEKQKAATAMRGGY